MVAPAKILILTPLLLAISKYDITMAAIIISKMYIKEKRPKTPESFI
jgi:hypothetical protein